MSKNDDDEVRKIASNWRDYLKETGESVRVFRWVWNEMISSQSKTWTMRLLACSLISTLLSMAVPWFIKCIMDGIPQTSPKTLVIGIIGFALCEVVLIKLAEYWESVCREQVWGQNFIHILRRMNGLFFEKSLGQHLSESCALSSSNMCKGRDSIFNIQSLLLFNNGLVEILQIIMAYAALWIISPLIGLVLTALIAVYLITTVVLNRVCLAGFTPIEAGYRSIFRAIHELWEKVERVKTCGQDDLETKSLVSRAEKTTTDDRVFSLWYIRWITIRSLLSGAAVIFIIVYGSLSVRHGHPGWTIGLLFPLFSWSRQFTSVLWRIGQIERQLNKALPAVQSLQSSLTMAPAINDHADAIDLPNLTAHTVEFRNVGLAYPSSGQDEDGDSTDKKAGQPVLKDVSFVIEPGQKVAILGESGVGKTSCARLVQRYMDPTAGAILVDGHDLRDIRHGSWTNAIAYIAQNPQILDGTIRSNLLFGLSAARRLTVTDEELWTLMRRLRIDFGSRLTEGLNTRVGRNGIKLSGGESQRLMIGAAALRGAIFMVIDEATSSLDSSTEKGVQEGLTEILRDDISALIIAHRLSTVQDCDKYVVLSEPVEGAGATVEAIAGSFEELHDVSPTFRRLVEDQIRPFLALAERIMVRTRDDQNQVRAAAS